MKTPILHQRLRIIPDYPLPGISFYDFNPYYRDPEGLREATDAMVKAAHTLSRGQDYTRLDFVGLESRGLMFAGVLAREFGCGFSLVRKAGKLPAPVHTLAYLKEYGKGDLEIAAYNGCGRSAILVDDVLATGGTLRTAGQLVELTGATLLGAVVLTRIPQFQVEMPFPIEVAVEL